MLLEFMLVSLFYVKTMALLPNSKLRVLIFLMINQGLLLQFKQWAEI